MKRGFVPCSECFDPVPISGPEDRRAGVMCLKCARDGDGVPDLEALAAPPEPKAVCGTCWGTKSVYAGYDFTDGGKYLTTPCPDCQPAKELK